MNSISSYKLLFTFVIHKFDTISLSETYLNSDISFNDKNLFIPGYNFTRADHLSNTKPGEVCIYYKEALPLKLYNINYHNEFISFEAAISSKFYNLISFMSLSQSCDKFENFFSHLDVTLEACKY